MRLKKKFNLEEVRCKDRLEDEIVVVIVVKNYWFQDRTMARWGIEGWYRFTNRNSLAIFEAAGNRFTYSSSS